MLLIPESWRAHLPRAQLTSPLDARLWPSKRNPEVVAGGHHEPLLHQPTMPRIEGGTLASADQFVNALFRQLDDKIVLRRHHGEDLATYLQRVTVTKGSDAINPSLIIVMSNDHEVLRQNEAASGSCAMSASILSDTSKIVRIRYG